MSELCHCGQPLHYTDPEVEREVRRMVADLGEFTTITVEGLGSWRVQRHYIALHGVIGHELPTLGFEPVSEPV